MVKEKGITLVSLTVTIILLCILAAVLINIGAYNNIIQRKFQVENQYEELLENVEENIDSIQDQWGDLL